MSDALFDLGGRIALITGSSGGLGFTFARGLGQAGAEIVLNGRDEEKLSKAVDALQAQNLTAHGYAFDITRKQQVVENVSRIEREVGPIDILVNNAGVNLRGPMHELEEEAWNETLAINLTGAFLASQPVVKSMIERRRGKIVNICSLMSEVSRPKTASYSASKGGLKMLTKAMALELAQHNIQVNGIGPGYFITEMTQPLADDAPFDEWLRARTPAGRWGDPEELIGPLVFLCSDAASFVTGQILYVDGGILATL